MSLEWMLIRGSGLVAFALLGSSTIWGLLVSTRVLGKAVKAKGVTWFHESLGIGSLVATVVHMVALSIHDYVDFSWGEILIPGRSDWRPVAVSLGVVGFYVLTVVTTSFYAKRWIGQAAWRAVHHLSFGLFVAVLGHGLFAGSDTTHPAVVAMYAGTGAAVAILFTIRLMQTSATPTRAETAQSVARRPAPEPRSGRGPGVDPPGVLDVSADLRHERVE